MFSCIASRESFPTAHMNVFSRIQNEKKKRNNNNKKETINYEWLHKKTFVSCFKGEKDK